MKDDMDLDDIRQLGYDKACEEIKEWGPHELEYCPREPTNSAVFALQIYLDHPSEEALEAFREGWMEPMESLHPYYDEKGELNKGGRYTHPS